MTQYKEEAVKSRLWRCSICTYDNDEGMSVCDICGVLRNPKDYDSSNNNKKTGIDGHLPLIAFYYVVPDDYN